MLCDVIISVDPGLRVEITFDDFDVDDTKLLFTPYCSDFLQVRDKCGLKYDIISTCILFLTLHCIENPHFRLRFALLGGGGGGSTTNCIVYFSSLFAPVSLPFYVLQ